MARISTLEDLRAKYPPTSERAILKELPALEAHCRRFIGLSPFLVIGTTSRDGRAELRDDADLLGRFVVDGKAPRLVVLVQVDAVYLHCAKAIMRSRLWEPESRVARSVLPTMGEMIRDQVGGGLQAESQEEMEARYRTQLY